MAVSHHENEAEVTPQGRLTLPEQFRLGMNLKPGDRLLIRQEGQRLILERREHIEQQLWAMFKPSDEEESLTSELISERRAEAAKEQ